MTDDSSRSRLGFGVTLPAGGDAMTNLAQPASPEGADGPEGIVGQLIAERYRVISLLGVGGMGCVYRAEHIHMRKIVALKTLHREMTRVPEAVARFEREAVAASRISHPNVVVATDFGRLADGAFYLALEYIEGRSLRAELDSQGALSLAQALRITLQIARALEAAHGQGIVHRDLKPDNVMLVERNGQTDFVKVLDFGIAKLQLDDSSAGLTQMGHVFGTPEYMSPEQCMGQLVDSRSDLYSLGIILYEMLCGRLPFVADEPIALLSMHMTQPPAALDPSVDPEVADLTLQLLEKSPSARVQSASELTAFCERRLADAIVGAGVETRGARLDRASSTRARLQGAASGAARLASLANRGVALLARPVTVGRRIYPGKWVWGSLGLLLATLGMLSVVVGRHSNKEVPVAGVRAATTGAPVVASAAPRDSSESEFARQVARIEYLPTYKRTESDWRMLARGYTELGQFEKAALAYQAILSLRPLLRNDAVLLADLKRAAGAGEPRAFRIAVNLAERPLGRHGVDLLWELWQELKSKPERAEEAEKLQKKLTILSRRASHALRCAIELGATRDCSKLLGLVERATKDADQRALPRLEAMQTTTGCGPGNREDCFYCLRDTDRLTRAMERARTHSPPRLGETPDSE